VQAAKSRRVNTPYAQEEEETLIPCSQRKHQFVKKENRRKREQVKEGNPRSRTATGEGEWGGTTCLTCKTAWVKGQSYNKGEVIAGYAGGGGN